MKKFLAVIFAVVILATFMAVPAMAADSPSGEVVFKVEVNSFSTGKVSNGNYTTEGDTIRLTVAEDSDYTFTGWVIEGKYEIVSGDLKSKELVIRPLSDVKVEESYDVKGSAGFGTTNDSDKAPDTGVALPVVAFVALAGAFTVMVVSKKRLAA